MTTMMITATAMSRPQAFHPPFSSSSSASSSFPRGNLCLGFFRFAMGSRIKGVCRINPSSGRPAQIEEGDRLADGIGGGVHGDGPCAVGESVQRAAFCSQGGIGNPFVDVPVDHEGGAPPDEHGFE